MVLKILDENEYENLWLRFGSGFCPYTNGVILEYEDSLYIVDLYSGIAYRGKAPPVQETRDSEQVRQEEYVLPMFTLSAR